MEGSLNVLVVGEPVGGEDRRDLPALGALREDNIFQDPGGAFLEKKKRFVRVAATRRLQQALEQLALDRWHPVPLPSSAGRD